MATVTVTVTVTGDVSREVRRDGRATDEFGDSTTDRPRRGRTSLGNELPSRVAPS